MNELDNKWFLWLFVIVVIAVAAFLIFSGGEETTEVPEMVPEVVEPVDQEALQREKDRLEQQAWCEANPTKCKG